MMKQSPVARIFGLVCDWYYLKGTMWRTFWFGRTIGLGKLVLVQYRSCYELFLVWCVTGII